MALLYHFWQYRAYFSVRYCPKLFAYNTEKRELVFSQDVVCEQDGLRPDRIHHMIFAGSNTIYAGENDNNDRSSYLWELELEN